MFAPSQTVPLQFLLLLYHASQRNKRMVYSSTVAGRLYVPSQYLVYSKCKLLHLVQKLLHQTLVACSKLQPIHGLLPPTRSVFARTCYGSSHRCPQSRRRFPMFPSSSLNKSEKKSRHSRRREAMRSIHLVLQSTARSRQVRFRSYNKPQRAPGSLPWTKQICCTPR